MLVRYISVLTLPLFGFVAGQGSSLGDADLPAQCSAFDSGCSRFERVAQSCGAIQDEASQLICACTPSVLSDINSCYDCLTSAGADLNYVATVAGIREGFTRDCPASALEGATSTGEAISATSEGSSDTAATSTPSASTPSATSTRPTSTPTSVSSTATQASQGVTSANTNAGGAPASTTLPNAAVSIKHAEALPLLMAALCAWLA